MYSGNRPFIRYELKAESVYLRHVLSPKCRKMLQKKYLDLSQNKLLFQCRALLLMCHGLGFS